MTPALAATLLIAGTLLWFLLPLLPALRELYHPTDITPLQVVGRDAADVELFARGFRGYLERQLQQLPDGGRGELAGKLPDGTPFVQARQLPEQLLEEARREEGLDRVVVLTMPSTLRGGETFVREVYARAIHTCGPRTVYRALLGDAALMLGPGSVVLRWVHTPDELVVGDGSLLAGRASAGRAIRLGHGVSFDRVSAPRIVVSGGSQLAELEPVPLVPFSLPEERTVTVGDHQRVTGDLDIPPGAVYQGHLVVTGGVMLGAQARIEGSLKAHGAVQIGTGAAVTGAVVSRTRVITGLRARIGGPVVAEELVELGPGTVIAAPTSPTSLAAPRIVLGHGVTIHGLVTATEGGATDAAGG